MLALYKNIKEIRLNQNMSQQTLAEKVGYTGKSMISKVERGEVDLSTTMIKKFAEALNVSPSYLMGWDSEQIEQASQMQKDVAVYDDELEQLLVNLSDLDLTKKELERIYEYAKMMISWRD